MNIQSTLEAIVGNSTSHAKWLNSLSYLEYRGFKKIVKSQSSECVDETVLGHTFEEVRHAFLLKKLALRIGGKSFSRYDSDSVFCFPSLKKYFYSLDRDVDFLIQKSDARSQKMTYLIVTLLVEERAMEIYNAYQGILERNKLDVNLSALLKDESKHLSEVLLTIQSMFPDWPLKKIEFKSIEEKYFSELWRDIEGCL